MRESFRPISSAKESLDGIWMNKSRITGVGGGSHLTLKSSRQRGGRGRGKEVLRADALHILGLIPQSKV